MINQTDDHWESKDQTMITDVNKEYKNYDILLFDPHGEYTGCLSTLPNYAPDYKDQGLDFTDTWIRCLIIWDGYQMADLVRDLGNEWADQGDRRVTEAFHFLFGNKLDDLIDFATPDSATI